MLKRMKIGDSKVVANDIKKFDKLKIGQSIIIGLSLFEDKILKSDEEKNKEYLKQLDDLYNKAKEADDNSMVGNDKYINLMSDYMDLKKEYKEIKKQAKDKYQERKKDYKELNKKELEHKGVGEPDWLSSMTETQRKDYFQLHPNSKYNK